MKVLGIVAEYNPMHNGHIHHINISKEIVEPDYTICVMSGFFTQRGEPCCPEEAEVPFGGRMRTGKREGNR